MRGEGKYQWKYKNDRKSMREKENIKGSIRKIGEVYEGKGNIKESIRKIGEV